MDFDDVIEMIKMSVVDNKDNIMKSSECACIDCFHKFKPDEITMYHDENEATNVTAVCPNCWNDVIIPNYLIQYTLDDLKRYSKLYLNNDTNENATELKQMSKEDIKKSTESFYGNFNK